GCRRQPGRRVRPGQPAAGTLRRTRPGGPGTGCRHFPGVTGMSGEKLRNIGPKSAAWLRQVGLRTREDLEAAGPLDAYMRVRRAGFRPSLNLLYALEGALRDIHWQEVPDERRKELVEAAEAA